jgi:hypothetical protein
VPADTPPSPDLELRVRPREVHGSGPAVKFTAPKPLPPHMPSQPTDHQPRNQPTNQPTGHQVRSELPLSPSSYGLSTFLSYALYPPLYIAGPILTFNAFASQLAGARWLVGWLVSRLPIALPHTARGPLHSSSIQHGPPPHPPRAALPTQPPPKPPRSPELPCHP